MKTSIQTEVVHGGRGRHRLNCSASGQGELSDTCEHINELLGSIQSNEELLASQEGLCSIRLVSYVYMCTLFIV